MTTTLARCLLIGVLAAGAASTRRGADLSEPPRHVRGPVRARRRHRTLARMLGQRLEQRLGKPFLIEHRPGAGGVTGAVAAARAAPDGHTILMAPSPVMAINVTLHKKPPYDPAADFVPLALVVLEPLCPGGQPVAAGAFGGRPRQAGQGAQRPLVRLGRSRHGPIIYSRNCSRP